MTGPILSDKGTQAIDGLISSLVRDGHVPALYLGATSKDGELYWGRGGNRMWGQPAEGLVSDDTILQLFSCTKLVTVIACFQLIDGEQLSLDDSEIIEKYCPELGELQILEGYTEDGKERMKKPSTKITLRLLLTHTSGLSYGFNSPLVERWRTEHNTPSQFSPNAPLSSLLQPLIFEPGTHYCYSIAVDWAGILVSRMTGMSLEGYFQEHIFKPCGITSMSFHPPPNYEAVQMGMTERDPPHTGEVRLMRKPAMDRTLESEEIGPIYMGGGGLFGTARDYLHLLRGILASSDPSNPSHFISPSSFALLFTDCLPPVPRMKVELAAMAKAQNFHDPDLLINGEQAPIGASLAFFLNFNESKHGRMAMSGCWDGAAKTMFWMDSRKGIAAICFTNIMCPNPDPCNKMYNDFERLLYDHLA